MRILTQVGKYYFETIGFGLANGVSARYESFNSKI